MRLLRQSSFALLLASLPTTRVFAQQQAYEGTWEMHPMWRGWGLAMMSMMILSWGLIIVGVVLASAGCLDKANSRVLIRQPKFYGDATRAARLIMKSSSPGKET